MYTFFNNSNHKPKRQKLEYLCDSGRSHLGVAFLHFFPGDTTRIHQTGVVFIDAYLAKSEYFTNLDFLETRPRSCKVSII